MINTEEKVKCIKGTELGLAWLEEITSVYSESALHMDWYRHRDMEITCCNRGEMAYEIEGHGIVNVRAGEAVIIPPRTGHRQTGGIDSPSRRISFKLKRYDGESYFKAFTKSEFLEIKRRLLSRVASPILLSPTARVQAETLGKSIHAAEKNDGGSRRAVAGALLRITISGLLVECAFPESIVTRADDDIIDSAIAYLDENLSKDVSIDRLVARIGYGRTRFFELFRKRTGHSPNEYLVRRRIERSKQLLKDTDRSISDIAREVGITDQNYFSRCFKRLTGYSPSEFGAAN